MANLKISQLDPAASLTGTELVELVQDGANVRGTVNSLTGVRTYVIPNSTQAPADADPVSLGTFSPEGFSGGDLVELRADFAMTYQQNLGAGQVRLNLNGSPIASIQFETVGAGIDSLLATVSVNAYGIIAETPEDTVLHVTVVDGSSGDVIAADYVTPPRFFGGSAGGIDSSMELTLEVVTGAPNITCFVRPAVLRISKVR